MGSEEKWTLCTLKIERQTETIPSREDLLLIMVITKYTRIICQSDAVATCN